MADILKSSQKIGLTLSYVICVNVYVFTKNLFKIIVWYVFRWSYSSTWLMVSFDFINYFMMFLCGFFIGFFIHRNSIIHAALATALGGAGAYLVSGISLSEYILFIKGGLAGFVIGAIGGGGAVIVRKYRWL